MTIEGRIEGQQLEDLLRQVGADRNTGILTLQGEQEIIGMTFLQGELVSVDAVNQAPEAGLGRVLFERSWIGEEEFAVLVGEDQSGGGRLNDLLVERGHLSRDQLNDALRTHRLRLCSEALGWTTGQYRFYQGDEVAFEEGVPPIPVEELLRLGDGGPTAGPVAVEAPAPVEVAAEPSPVETPVAVEEVAADAAEAPRPLWEMDQGGEEYDFEEDLEPVPERESLWSRLSEEVSGEEFDIALWGGRAVATCGLLALVALVVTAPTRLWMPLRFQEPLRDLFERQQQGIVYSEVDRAAKTYYLLEGNFPASLDEVAQRGLLVSPNRLVEEDGDVWYADAPVSYLVRIEPEDGETPAARSVTIAGNFLLDPSFSDVDDIDRAPLLLLD